MILRLLGALAALAFVLLLAWLVLQWMSRRTRGSTPGKSNRLLNVLDRVHFGKNSSLLLVRVRDKVYFIAASEHAIEKIGEFDDPDETIVPPTLGENLPFSTAMKDALEKLKKPKNPNGPGGTL